MAADRGVNGAASPSAIGTAGGRFGFSYPTSGRTSGGPNLQPLLALPGIIEAGPSRRSRPGHGASSLVSVRQAPPAVAA